MDWDESDRGLRSSLPLRSHPLILEIEVLNDQAPLSMATLHVLKGTSPLPGVALPLPKNGLELGRSTDAGATLADRGVSRRHAKVWPRDGHWWIEDLGSSNGTQVNGLSILHPVRLQSGDQLQLGPFVLQFIEETPAHENARILSQTLAGPTSNEIFQDTSGRRLRAILELTRSLGAFTELDPLFNRVAGHLFQLFPGADRILMLEGPPNDLHVTGGQMRGGGTALNRAYSRTLLHRVTTENIGLVASQAMDLGAIAGNTLVGMGVQSFVCAPLHDEAGKSIGALLLDRFRPGPPFPRDDLMLLTTIAIQVSISLQNHRLQARLLDQARLQHDLALARDIQQAYLPLAVPDALKRDHEVAAMLTPAQEVAGDFYDYFPLDSETSLLVVGDVTGKGIPAALFLTSVRSLLRHLASTTRDPGELLLHLNNALAANNPNGMFITLAAVTFEAASGRLTLALGGHPAPILFTPGSQATPLRGPSGRLIGFMELNQPIPTVTTILQPGEALMFYTDGVTEAPALQQSPTMFGEARLCTFLRRQHPDLSLDRIHCNLCDELERYTGSPIREDDVTLLSIRRRA